MISAAVHAYVSQSDRGEIVMGAGADVYNSYAQRGAVPLMRATVGAVLELFPCFSRLRLMRQWAGMVDVTPDTTPIMGLTPWRVFTSTAAGARADTRPSRPGVTPWPTPSPTIGRIRSSSALASIASARGALIDEGAAAGVAH